MASVVSRLCISHVATSAPAVANMEDVAPEVSPTISTLNLAACLWPHGPFATGPAALSAWFYGRASAGDFGTGVLLRSAIAIAASLSLTSRGVTWRAPRLRALSRDSDIRRSRSVLSNITVLSGSGCRLVIGGGSFCWAASGSRGTSGSKLGCGGARGARGAHVLILAPSPEAQEK